jgi:hypothetical protein
MQIVTAILVAARIAIIIMGAEDRIKADDRLVEAAAAAARLARRDEPARACLNCLSKVNAFN